MLSIDALTCNATSSNTYDQPRRTTITTTKTPTAYRTCLDRNHGAVDGVNNRLLLFYCSQLLAAGENRTTQRRSRENTNAQAGRRAGAGHTRMSYAKILGPQVNPEPTRWRPSTYLGRFKPTRFPSSSRTCVHSSAYCCSAFPPEQDSLVFLHELAGVFLGELPAVREQPVLLVDHPLPRGLDVLSPKRSKG